MKLTVEERKMAEGYYGEATALAMSIMVKLGEAYDAEEMIQISSAHIDGAIYRSPDEVSLTFAERLANSGAKVRVPTTLSMGARDITRWQEFKLPSSFAEGCQRMEQAYLRMGAIPLWTCAPYLHGIIPHFGEQIAWAESNAIAFANSVIGARTARYGDFADICAAIVGRVPNFDLHLSENRRGQVLLKLKTDDTTDFNDDSLYPVIGYAVGLLSPDGIPVIEGIPKSITTDQLKALSAAAASSGNIALFHIVGVTPEASTCEQAFRGLKPVRVGDIGRKELSEARASLSTVSEGKADLVTMGCPHASFAEFEQVNHLLKGRKISSDVEFWITTNRAVYYLLQQTGLLESVKASGIKIMTDSCIFSGHYNKYWDFKLVVTNSAKFAHYAPMSLKGIQSIFCRTADCIEAALTGEVQRIE